MRGKTPVRIVNRTSYTDERNRTGCNKLVSKHRVARHLTPDADDSSFEKRECGIGIVEPLTIGGQ